MSSSPEALLKSVFGYDQFKPLQREIIENVLHKRDTLAILPTGAGKSLCAQLPALIFPGLTVVVSPLIALMKDQVDQLHELGVPALFLNSSLSPQEYQTNLALVRGGQIKLLYIAPERLLTQGIFELLDGCSLDCLVIDEAHCISEWGHDFRPEYRQLAAVRQRYPKAVCLALTATATPRVRQDIKDSLGFLTSNEFVASFNRDNLLIEVTPKTDPAAQTLSFLRQFPNQSGIIYCFSRKQVEDLASFLKRNGFSALPYHAGLPDEERSRSQELFKQDDVQIIVATIAFGMGIDKPNVRFVVHYDLPKSIESYYQEIGRAGRDGLPSHCLLLYNYGDAMKLRHFMDQKEEGEREAAYAHLQALTRYAESDICRRVPLLAYFGETFTTENCGMCDNCLGGQKEQVDITILAQKFLSCVKRTGERFGAGHVIDVLLGSANQKVLKYNHQTLSTYGIGKELSQKQWQQIARQMVQKGLLAQEETYGVLSLTPQAYTLLKNREPVMGFLREEERQLARGKKSTGLEYDHGLFEILRRERKELADEAHVPPYAIFPDRTLMEMAAYLPVTPEGMLAISGVGQFKLARYGKAFMSLILDYCQDHKIEPGRSRGQSRAAPKTRIGKARFEEVGEAYNAGKTVAQLAEELKVQPSTILSHLTEYARAGQPLRGSDELLEMLGAPVERQTAALALFRELGVEKLSPVFERLGGTVSYDELKILRLHYLSHLT